MASERPRHNPAQDSEPESFAQLLKALRKGAGGLSQRQAASRVGVSQGRWAQVERGYVRGAGDSTGAGPDFVVKVAEYFGQDPRTLLTLAGHDPDDATIEPTPEVLPSALMDVWPDLDRKQRLALVIHARLMADPHSVIDWSEILGELPKQHTKTDTAPEGSRVVTGADVTNAESRHRS